MSFITFFTTSLSFTDYPRPWQVSFQKPATTMMEGIIDLHHDIFAFLIIILIFVSVMLGTILLRYPVRFRVARKGIPVLKYVTGHGITHNTKLEIVWTIIPTLVLLLIATPSFALIYALDEIVEPELTIRVVGRQWYWTYEFPDNVVLHFPQGRYLTELLSGIDVKGSPRQVISQNSSGHILPLFQQALVMDRWNSSNTATFGANISDLVFKQSSLYQQWLAGKEGLARLVIPGFSFNSYIVATDDLFPGAFRLLEVDRRLVLPFSTNIRVLVTSYDVIHSWTVPAFGIKVDALPGRLNEYYLNLNYLGLFYGQCSEICGVNHGFMPIKVEVTTEEQFKWWFLRTSLLENSPLKFRNIFTQLAANPQNSLEKYVKSVLSSTV